MRPLHVWLALCSFSFAACGRVCNLVDGGTPHEVCQRADAGAALKVTEYSSGPLTCRVSHDGGEVTLAIDAPETCSTQGFASNPVVALATVDCDLSALAPGSYSTVTTGTVPSKRVSFTLPYSADAGIAACD